MEAIGVMGKKQGARAACIAHVPCVLAESLKFLTQRLHSWVGLQKQNQMSPHSSLFSS